MGRGVDRVFYTFVGANVLFLATGVVLGVVSYMWMKEMDAMPAVETIARDSIISKAPLTGGIANAILIFATFSISLPALAMPTSTIWLRLHAALVVCSAIFTLVLGLIIWYETLSTTARLGDAWKIQKPDTQSLLQNRFKCCGYYNSTSPQYVTDKICTDDFSAASRPGCARSFADYANAYLAMIFTGSFGFVAVDMIVLLCAAMVVRKRKEEIRYRHLDAKQGL